MVVLTLYLGSFELDQSDTSLIEQTILQYMLTWVDSQIMIIYRSCIWFQFVSIRVLLPSSLRYLISRRNGWSLNKTDTFWNCCGALRMLYIYSRKVVAWGCIDLVVGQIRRKYSISFSCHGLIPTSWLLSSIDLVFGFRISLLGSTFHSIDVEFKLESLDSK